MIVKKLCINAVMGATETYDFEKAATYPTTVINVLKQHLGYALFGNDTLFEGSATLNFVHNDEEYVLTRNFEKNESSLIVGNHAPVFDPIEISNILSPICSENINTWLEKAVIDSKTVVDGTLSDAKTFLSDVIGEYVDEASTTSARNVYEKDLLAIENKLDVLGEIKGRKAEDVLASVNDYENKLVALKKEATPLAEDVESIENLLDTQSEYENTQKALENAENKVKALAKDREKYLLSEKLKKQLSIEKTASVTRKEKEDLETSLATDGETLLQLETSLNAGYRVAKKKEEVYLEANEKVKALNVALDELIEANLTEGKRDDYLIEKANAIFGKLIARRQMLNSKREKLMESKYALEEEIALTIKRLTENNYGAEKKKAIREGAGLEAIVSEKEELASFIDNLYADQTAQLDLIKQNLKKEQERLIDAKARKAAIFSELPADQRTLNALNRKLSTLERYKQNLYRNQILSASLLQEISAIDKKVDENVEVRKGCLENISALNSAKETLDNYTAKIAVRLQKQEERLIVLNSEMYNFSKLDEIEYGGKCPVCTAPIMEKVVSKEALKKLSDCIDNTNQDIAKLRGIVDEHAAKSATIQQRLGALIDQEKTLNGYIKSLESTKLIKMRMIKNLYTECNVDTHDQLTANLESAIQEVGKLNAFIQDVKEVTSEENHAQDVIAKLTDTIARYENSVLPSIKNYGDDARKMIVEFNEVNGDFRNQLDGKTAFSMLDEAISVEEKEDELIAILVSADEKLTALNLELSEIETELNEKDIVTIDGKEYDYDTLCFRLTGEHYDEVIKEIRLAEKDRQQKQDEYVALTRLLKDKQAEVDTLRKSIEERKVILNADIAYLEVLTESLDYDESVTGGKSYEELSSSILSDEESQKIAKKLKDADDNVAFLTQKALALQLVLDENKDLLNLKEEKIAALKELVAQIDENEKLLANEKTDLIIATRIENQSQALYKTRSILRKTLSELDEIALGSADGLLIAKVNSALATLLPGYRLKLTEGALKAYYTDEKGISKSVNLNEEQKSLLGVIITASITNILSTVRHSPALRIITLNASLKDNVKSTCQKYALNSGLITLFTK